MARRTSKQHAPAGDAGAPSGSALAGSNRSGGRRRGAQPEERSLEPTERKSGTLDERADHGRDEGEGAPEVQEGEEGYEPLDRGRVCEDKGLDR